MRRGQQALVVSAANIDLAQLSGLANLPGYAPDGRVNGTIRVTDLFRKPSAAASLRASGVKLGRRYNWRYCNYRRI